MTDGSQNKSLLFDGGDWLASFGRDIGIQRNQARIYRAIGQDLAGKGIATFCLRLVEDRYLVRGLTDMGKQAGRTKSLWAKLRQKTILWS